MNKGGPILFQATLPLLGFPETLRVYVLVQPGGEAPKIMWILGCMHS